MEGLNTILSNESVLAMVLTPGIVISIVLLVMAYRLVITFGKMFIDEQKRQATAFEKIADGVLTLHSMLDHQKNHEEDVRITLRTINEKLDRIIIAERTAVVRPTNRTAKAKSEINGE